MSRFIVFLLGLSMGAGAAFVFGNHFQKPTKLKMDVFTAREKDNDGKLRTSVDVLDLNIKGALLEHVDVISKLADPVPEPELAPYASGWSAWEIYKGKRVQIPDAWVIHSFAFDGGGDIERKEKQTWLALGWRGYDAEAVVALGIFGKNEMVQAEVARLGGAEIHVLHNGKEIVAFPEYRGGQARGYYSRFLSPTK